MYIYHALIDTLSAHIMHININNASDTLTFVIPRVNTKTFGERYFFLRWPICLEQFAPNTPHSDSAIF